MSWMKIIALAVLVATLIAILSIGVIVTSDLAEGAHFNTTEVVVDEFSGAFTVLLLILPLAHFIRRFPITRRTLHYLPLHVFASMIFGAAHTSLMWLSRSVLYPLFGLGVFDFGDLRFRYAMEYQKQFVVYVLIYLTGEWMRTVRERREASLRSAELEQQLTRARLDALKMQLNPHFLFNTLNLISSHVYDDPKTADAMISRLSDFLRATLQDGQEQQVTLQRELKLLSAYLDIMQARFGERLRVSIDVSADAQQALVPPLLLQPLVENSIVHSLEEGNASIRLDANLRDSMLTLVLDDSGPGLAPMSPSKGTGTGLANTRARLTELYGSKATLDIHSLPHGGARVTISLPQERRA